MGFGKTAGAVLEEEILPFLAFSLREPLRRLPAEVKEDLLEIRLRLGRMVMLVKADGDLALPGSPCLDQAAMDQTLQFLTQSSFYAREEELRQGFITLPGGHRVGMVGRAVLEQGRIRTLKHISGLNIRLARQVLGAADSVLPYLVENGEFLSTLIISPPGAGKTTLLRDLIRQVSTGVPLLGLKGHKVGVVDERSELAASYLGVPQNDVGPRTDVLDGAGKAEGIMLLLRSMSPEVIATDEVGSRADVAALEEALVSGVRLIATAHGHGIKDLSRRPFLRGLIARGLFNRIVCLGNSCGPGTVEEIRSGDGLKLLGPSKQVKGKEMADALQADRSVAFGLRYGERRIYSCPPIRGAS
ncbi:MAG: stage sporulation protein [Bacillota bacterium]|jgi:stage III sporulation protein AA|nr:stage sporulation protein [Bacillota bacterium]MDK2926129.1 stage sporulation protein [Bacillota bacterium]MDK2960476.1 stage sporulation protein [Bacillota bacterium]